MCGGNIWRGIDLVGKVSGWRDKGEGLGVMNTGKTSEINCGDHTTNKGQEWRELRVSGPLPQKNVSPPHHPPCFPKALFI